MVSPHMHTQAHARKHALMHAVTHTHLFVCARSDGVGQKNLNCMFSGEGVKAQHDGPAASGEGAFSNIVMQVCA